jgi:hypothetical protein
MTETRSGVGVHGEDVPALLDRWARLGLLSPEQVEQILQAEGMSPPPAGVAVPEQRPAAAPEPGAQPVRNRLAVEALGYLGGVLALAAALLLVQLLWEDLSTGARLAVPLVATAVLLVAGALVPAREGEESMQRLRSALWLLAVGAWFASFVVFGDQVLEADGKDTGLMAALGAVALAVPLYVRTHEAAQQLALFAALVGSAAMTGARPDWDEPTLVGLGGWLVSVAWFVAAERGWVTPAVVGRYLGALAMILFVLPMGGALAGQLIAVVTAAALFVWAVRVDSIGLLVVASYGTLQLVPSIITFFFPDNTRIAVPLGLLGIGGALVSAAVVVSRRRARRQPPSSPAEPGTHARR